MKRFKCSDVSHRPRATTSAPPAEHKICKSHERERHTHKSGQWNQVDHCCRLHRYLVCISVCVRAHAFARACSEVKAAIGFWQEARAPWHMIIDQPTSDRRIAAIAADPPFMMYASIKSARTMFGGRSDGHIAIPAGLRFPPGFRCAAVIARVTALRTVVLPCSQAPASSSPCVSNGNGMQPVTIKSTQA